MADIILFTSDFQLGTKLSEAIIQLDKSIIFADNKADWSTQITSDTKAVILDLDDPGYGTVSHVSSLWRINKEMLIIGVMSKVQKLLHDKLRSAGCGFILPRSSLVKNLPSLLKDI